MKEYMKALVNALTGNRDWNQQTATATQILRQYPRLFKEHTLVPKRQYFLEAVCDWLLLEEYPSKESPYAEFFQKDSIDELSALYDIVKKIVEDNQEDKDIVFMAGVMAHCQIRSSIENFNVFDIEGSYELKNKYNKEATDFYMKAASLGHKDALKYLGNLQEESQQCDASIIQSLKEQLAKTTEELRQERERGRTMDGGERMGSWRTQVSPPRSRSASPVKREPEQEKSHSGRGV